jgi:expansin (peptidoglycan-binding protein)
MFYSNTLVLIATALFAAFAVVSQAAAIEARSSSYSGTATFYSVKKSGKPSCGGKADNDDLVAALSKKFMKKKYCGEKIKVKSGHKSITAKVVDTCNGCGKHDIDLSPTAFEKLGKKSKGELDVKWSFH